METNDAHTFCGKKAGDRASLHRNLLANKCSFISFPFFTGKLTLPLTAEEGVV